MEINKILFKKIIEIMTFFSACAQLEIVKNPYLIIMVDWKK